VKSFEQVKGLDHQQIFAAPVLADTFRTLLAIATLLDWDISNIDIDSAYFKGGSNTVWLGKSQWHRLRFYVDDEEKSLYQSKVGSRAHEDCSTAKGYEHVGGRVYEDCSAVRIAST
jgi:hypothetical protein